MNEQKVDLEIYYSPPFLFLGLINGKEDENNLFTENVAQFPAFKSVLDNLD